MTKVNFYDSIDDSMLKFAVIIAKHNGKWVFCKHRERSTWEVPGGHREQGEDILETAKSEYSCAITPQVRQAGNRLSGLTETAYASLLA